MRKIACELVAGGSQVTSKKRLSEDPFFFQKERTKKWTQKNYTKTKIIFAAIWAKTRRAALGLCKLCTVTNLTEIRTKMSGPKDFGRLARRAKIKNYVTTLRLNISAIFGYSTKKQTKISNTGRLFPKILQRPNYALAKFWPF